MSQIILTIRDIDPVDLFGEKNKNINLVKKAYPEVTITPRGNNIKLNGEKKYTQRVKKKIEMMVNHLKAHDGLSDQTVIELLDSEGPKKHLIPSREASNTILYGRNGKPIKAKTRNQKKMVDLADYNDVLFAIGPAGTGKTYTAVALAVRALKNKMVKKIILTRPAVEAGENLGFLPGDLKDKIDPYLRPLYDALDEMFPSEKLKYFMENRTIEIAPLAFMRGRTLNNAFVILDEAQNATSMQIKMFLTRLGPSAKCIVTGDLSQVDLPYNQKSGLRKALDILNDIEGIGKIILSNEDVVRHRLVKAIIERYESAGDDNRNQRARRELKHKEEE